MHRRTARTTRKQRRTSAVVLPNGCPRCGHRLIRVNRTFWDRLPAFVRRTRRFSCKNKQCAWRGVVYCEPNALSLRIGFWVLVLALSAWLTTKFLPIFVDHFGRPRVENEAYEPLPGR
jgi:hypothetical protein